MAINSKKIAKNSIFLYCRLIINMVISLYISRVLLNALGVDDFGIYGVVGGIAVMFSSLRSSFASAVQRFYNFEIGKGDNQKRMIVLFNTGFYIHVVLSFLLAFLLEVAGLWLIYNKLTFPAGHLDAALYVFHCTVVTTFLTTICIPFDALILAREKMDYFASISIFDSLLKLGFVISLQYIDDCRLNVYASALCLIQIINLLCNVTFCVSKFNECRLWRAFDKDIFKQMSTFAGWGFFGNIAFSLGNEVSNFFLNIFGGVVYNASRSIAYQVKAAVLSFLANGVVALRPQAVQQFASGNKDSFFKIIYFTSKTMFFVSILMAIPIIIYVKDILTLWLGNVPELSDVFVQLIMIQVLIRSFHEPIDIVFKSTGHLRNYQFASLVSTVLIIPISYIFLKIGYPLYIVFVLMIFMELLELILIICLAGREGMNVKLYLFKVTRPCLFILTICGIIYSMFYLQLIPKVNFLIGSILIDIILAVCIVFIGYDSSDRNRVFSILKNEKNE